MDPAGFEPTATSLQRRNSPRLSYAARECGSSETGKPLLPRVYPERLELSALPLRRARSSCWNYGHASRSMVESQSGADDASLVKGRRPGASGREEPGRIRTDDEVALQATALDHSATGPYCILLVPCPLSRRLSELGVEPRRAWASATCSPTELFRHRETSQEGQAGFEPAVCRLRADRFFWV